MTNFIPNLMEKKDEYIEKEFKKEKPNIRRVASYSYEAGYYQAMKDVLELIENKQDERKKDEREDKNIDLAQKLYEVYS